MKPIVQEDMTVKATRKGPDVWETEVVGVPQPLKGKRSRPRHLVHAASESEAINAGAEFFAPKFPVLMLTGSYRVDDAIIRILEDKRDSCAFRNASTADDYIALVRRYVTPNFSASVDEVRVDDIQSLYGFLISNGGKDETGVSAQTIRKLHAAIQCGFKVISRRTGMPNPFNDVELPKDDSSKVARAFTDREMSLYLREIEKALAEEPYDANGVLRRNALFGSFVSFHTGMRVGEVCALRRQDVRAIENTLRVEGSLSEKGGLHRKNPKTSAGFRSISLDSELKKALFDHFLWQKSFIPDAKIRDFTPICCKKNGEKIAPSVMSKTFKSFCSDIGIELEKGMSFHILRHTHASVLMALKENPRAVQTRLGHSKIETTLDRYGHVRDEEDAAISIDFIDATSLARGKIGDSNGD